jgi:hypothetical protein
VKNSTSNVVSIVASHLIFANNQSGVYIMALAGGSRGQLVFSHNGRGAALHLNAWNDTAGGASGVFWTFNAPAVTVYCINLAASPLPVSPSVIRLPIANTTNVSITNIYATAGFMAVIDVGGVFFTAFGSNASSSTAVVVGQLPHRQNAYALTCGGVPAVLFADASTVYCIGSADLRVRWSMPIFHGSNLSPGNDPDSIFSAVVVAGRNTVLTQGYYVNADNGAQLWYQSSGPVPLTATFVPRGAGAPGDALVAFQMVAYQQQAVYAFGLNPRHAMRYETYQKMRFAGTAADGSIVATGLAGIVMLFNGSSGALERYAYVTQDPAMLSDYNYYYDTSYAFAISAVVAHGTSVVLATGSTFVVASLQNLTATLTLNLGAVCPGADPSSIGVSRYFATVTRAGGNDVIIFTSGTCVFKYDTAAPTTLTSAQLVDPISALLTPALSDNANTVCVATVVGELRCFALDSFTPKPRLAIAPGSVIRAVIILGTGAYCTTGSQVVAVDITVMKVAWSMPFTDGHLVSGAGSTLVLFSNSDLQYGSTPVSILTVSIQAGAVSQTFGNSVEVTNVVYVPSRNFLAVFQPGYGVTAYNVSANAVSVLWLSVAGNTECFGGTAVDDKGLLFLDCVSGILVVDMLTGNLLTVAMAEAQNDFHLAVLGNGSRIVAVSANYDRAYVSVLDVPEPPGQTLPAVAVPPAATATLPPNATSAPVPTQTPPWLPLFSGSRALVERFMIPISLAVQCVSPVYGPLIIGVNVTNGSQILVLSATNGQVVQTFAPYVRSGAPIYQLEYAPDCSVVYPLVQLPSSQTVGLTYAYNPVTGLLLADYANFDTTLAPNNVVFIVAAWLGSAQRSPSTLVWYSPSTSASSSAPTAIRWAHCNGSAVQSLVMRNVTFAQLWHPAGCYFLVGFRPQGGLMAVDIAAPVDPALWVYNLTNRSEAGWSGGGLTVSADGRHVAISGTLSAWAFAVFSPWGPTFPSAYALPFFGTLQSNGVMFQEFANDTVMILTEDSATNIYVYFFTTDLTTPKYGTALSPFAPTWTYFEVTGVNWYTVVESQLLVGNGRGEGMLVYDIFTGTTSGTMNYQAALLGGFVYAPIVAASTGTRVLPLASPTSAPQSILFAAFSTSTGSPYVSIVNLTGGSLNVIASGTVPAPIGAFIAYTDNVGAAAAGDIDGWNLSWTAANHAGSTSMMERFSVTTTSAAVAAASVVDDGPDPTIALCYPSGVSVLNKHLAVVWQAPVLSELTSLYCNMAVSGGFVLSMSSFADTQLQGNIAGYALFGPPTAGSTPANTASGMFAELCRGTAADAYSISANPVADPFATIPTFYFVANTACMFRITVSNPAQPSITATRLTASAGAALSHRPLVTEPAVLLYRQEDSTVTAVARNATMDVLWRQPVEWSMGARSLIAATRPTTGNAVAILALQAGIYCFDAASGSSSYTAQTLQPVVPATLNAVMVFEAIGVLVVGFGSALTAYPLSGCPGPGGLPTPGFGQGLWSQTLNVALVGFPSQPTLVSIGIIVLDLGGHVQALNAQTGAVLWTTRTYTGPVDNVALVNGSLLYVTAQSGVTVIDSTTGLPRITYPDPGSQYVTTVVTQAGIFRVGTSYSTGGSYIEVLNPAYLPPGQFAPLPTFLPPPPTPVPPIPTAANPSTTTMAPATATSHPTASMTAAPPTTSPTAARPTTTITAPPTPATLPMTTVSPTASMVTASTTSGPPTSTPQHTPTATPTPSPPDREAPAAPPDNDAVKPGVIAGVAIGAVALIGLFGALIYQCTTIRRRNATAQRDPLAYSERINTPLNEMHTPRAAVQV